MREFSSSLRDELQRIEFGPDPGQLPGGMGTVRFVATCPFDADKVVERAKAVLKSLDTTALEKWPPSKHWSFILPKWFVEACSPPMTQAEAESWLSKWKNLSPEQQASEELKRDWALDDWLYWMEPPNRQWWWWDVAVVEDVDQIVVAVKVDDWPFPWGALAWLFRASGAAELRPEESV